MSFWSFAAVCYSIILILLIEIWLINYLVSHMHRTIKSLITLFAVVSLSLQSEVFFTPCPEGANRQCPSSTNRTDFLLSMKKGGTNILSTNDYLYDFFLCEEYNYDCGYMPQSDSYVTVGNGVSLDINATELASITTLTTT